MRILYYDLKEILLCILKGKMNSITGRETSVSTIRIFLEDPHESR